MAPRNQVLLPLPDMSRADRSPPIPFDIGHGKHTFAWYRSIEGIMGHGTSGPASKGNGTPFAPVRTDGTLEQYRRRGQDLLARYLREQGLAPGDGESSPEAFAAWLAEQRRRLRPATWRLYRQAALFLAEGWPDANLIVVARLLDEAPTPDGRPPPRTSARKLKRIAAQDFQALCRYLTREGATRASWETRDWLVAGTATGLRPGEWRQASLIKHGDRHLLVFAHEKTTNGRGLGKAGILDLTALAPPDLAAIHRMAERGRAWHAAREYTCRQEACGQLLRAACRTLWPTRTRGYSLYSCRHQATSHLKAARAPQEVAAVLGHAVTDTMVSYGKRRAAWPVDLRLPPPEPLPAAVKRVRVTRKTRRPRHDVTAVEAVPPVTQGRG
jgi:hypothetical protein